MILIFDHSIKVVDDTCFLANSRWQCDLSKPSCGQCTRYGRECTGYRNADDLNFRDESQRVAEKAQRRSTKNNIERTTRQSELARSLENRNLSCNPSGRNTPLPPLSMPVVDQAVCFFFRCRLNEPSESCRLVYKYLPSLYGADPSSALSCTINAIGLAGLSSYRRVPRLMSSACKQYSEALRLIGTALRDPMKANTDQVLLVVHLMGVYEVSWHTLVTNMKC